MKPEWGSYQSVFHLWLRWDPQSVRSLCTGITALKSAVDWVGDEADRVCEVCYKGEK